MFGAISKGDSKGYSYLHDIFTGIDNQQINYNWLISYPQLNSDGVFSQNFIWFTGGELTDFAQSNRHIQWIWGILSGFDKSISKEEALKYQLINADEYEGYYQNPPRFYHPLSTIEIAPCDSSWLIVISKDITHINSFKSAYISEDLF